MLLGVQPWIWCGWFVIHRRIWLYTCREFLSCLLKLWFSWRIWRSCIHCLSSFSWVENSCLILYLDMDRVVRITFHLTRSCGVLSIRFSSSLIVSLHVDSRWRAIHCIIHHAWFIHIFLPIYIERILSWLLLLLHITLRRSISLYCCVISNDWSPYYSKGGRILGLSRSLLIGSCWIITLQGWLMNWLLETLRHCCSTLGSHILLWPIVASRFLRLTRDISVMTHPWSKLTLVLCSIDRPSCLSLSFFTEWLLLLLLTLWINQFYAFIIIIIMSLSLLSLELHRMLLLIRLTLTTSWRQSGALVHNRHLSL